MVPLSFGKEWPELTVDAYPFCTVGKVDFSTGRSGSGALVGRNILVTCSHGIPWDTDGWWVKFTPALFDGNEPFGNSYVSDVRGYRTDPTITSSKVIPRIAPNVQN
jgi:V8-like Glu-specific endopeptidase